MLLCLFGELLDAMQRQDIEILKDKRVQYALTAEQNQKLRAISQVINDMPREAEKQTIILPSCSCRSIHFDQFFPFVELIYQLKTATKDVQNGIRQEIEDKINNLLFVNKISLFKVSDFLIVPLLDDAIIKNVAQDMHSPEQLQLFMNNNKKWQQKYKDVQQHHYLQKALSHHLLQQHYPALLQAFNVPCNTIDVDVEINSVAWNPDDEKLVAGTNDYSIRMWNSDTKNLPKKIMYPGWQIKSIAWSPDGETLAAGVYADIYIYDKNGNLLRVLKRHTEAINSISWSPDGIKLISGSDDASACIWRSDTGELLETIDAHKKAINSVAWSINGEKIAVASSDGTISIWNSVTYQLMRALDKHKQGVLAVAWSPDGSMLAGGSEDTTIGVWDCSSWKLIHTLTGHKGPIRSVAWILDNKMIASGSSDCTICIWDNMHGKRLNILAGHQDEVRSLAYNPDTKKLISGSRDKAIRIWDVALFSSFIHNVLKNLDLPQSLFVSSALSGAYWINNNDMVAIFDTLPNSVKDSIQNYSLFTKYMLPLVRVKNYLMNLIYCHDNNINA